MPRAKASDFFQDPDEKVVRDFDPEDDHDGNGDDHDESEDASDKDEAPERDARDHYQKVGKSKLRERALPLLGPEYRGTRVSRNEATDAPSHDPFGNGEDFESDQDSVDASLEDGSDDEEEDDEEEGAGSDEDDLDDDEQDEEEEDDEEDDEDTDDTSVGSERATKNERAELAGLLNNSSKTVAATLAAASAADAAKGRAVKTQRQAFDSLLNVRIRLQHALVSSNSMETVPRATPLDDETVYERAEAAALNLFNSLSELRDQLPSHQTGTKRKRAAFDSSSSTSKLWDHLQAQDERSKSSQRTILQKWSRKTQTATAEAVSNVNRLNPTSETTLLDVIDSHLSTTSMPRLVAKTRMPRSCAPLQQSRPRRTESKPDDTQEEEQIYDDADFYGVLLKELLEARSANAEADFSIAATNAANGNVESDYKAARQAKTHSRPDVDRKASKGRKMKYTVHEKLQNFMAPEDRGVWEERQRDDLFGSLFGKRNALQEDLDADSENDLAEEEALMLFRN